MGEQDLNIDPKTGKRKKRGDTADSHQNDTYQRHTDPQSTTRDYSIPASIPKEEFEEATGKDHGEAVAEYERNERERKEKDRLALAALDAE